MVNPKLVLTALSALTLSACVVAPYPRYRQGYVVQPAAAPIQQEGVDLAEADVAPPAPYAEVIPVAPFADAVWIGGYWGWQGGRHVWIGGRWDHGRVGYRWQPHTWVAIGGRWHVRGGFWARGRL